MSRTVFLDANVVLCILFGKPANLLIFFGSGKLHCLGISPVGAGSFRGG